MEKKYFKEFLIMSEAELWRSWRWHVGEITCSSSRNCDPEGWLFVKLAATGKVWTARNDLNLLNSIVLFFQGVLGKYPWQLYFITQRKQSLPNMVVWNNPWNNTLLQLFLVVSSSLKMSGKNVGDEHHHILVLEI